MLIYIYICMSVLVNLCSLLMHYMIVGGFSLCKSSHFVHGARSINLEQDDLLLVLCLFALVMAISGSIASSIGL
jgi:hypothetical protein